MSGKLGRRTAIVRKDHTKWECTEKFGHNEKHEPLYCGEIMKMSERVCKKCWCIRRVGAVALNDDNIHLGVLDKITKGIREWWDYLPEPKQSCE
jgi:hypothetical protein